MIIITLAEGGSSNWKPSLRQNAGVRKHVTLGFVLSVSNLFRKSALQIRISQPRESSKLRTCRDEIDIETIAKDHALARLEKCATTPHHTSRSHTEPLAELENPLSRTNTPPRRTAYQQPTM
jgi:hypothetical protein